jgi:hypothetical protein
MPKMSAISMFANLRRWLDILHDQHSSRVLLKRQQVFMRMQRQQSQWDGLPLRDGTMRFVLVNGPDRNLSASIQGQAKNGE